MERFQTAVLYDLTHTRAAELLRKYPYPWQILDELKDALYAMGAALPETEFDQPQPGVWIAKDAVVAKSAFLAPPCIIDHGAQIRHCAFLRGGVLIGKNSVVGNSTEVKNAVVFDNVQIPHFNYVGDSVLGYRSHLGAGAVTSNVKSDKTPVTILADGTKYPTGRKKFGAMVGDGTEVGCNSVLCPGTVIGKNATVYPLSRVRGYLPANSIFKDPEHIVPKTNQKEG